MLHLGAIKLDLEEPVSYVGAMEACEDLGLNILVNLDKLSEEKRVLCDNQLVPYDKPLLDDTLEPVADTEAPAVQLSSGQRQSVNFKFNCFLCQMKSFELPVESGAIHDDVTLSYRHVTLHVTRADAKDASKRLTRELWHHLKINKTDIVYHEQWLDDTQRLHIEYHISPPITTWIATGNVETSIFHGDFLMRVEDVSFCPEEETVNVDRAVTHWPRKAFVNLVVNTEFVGNASTGNHYFDFMFNTSVIKCRMQYEEGNHLTCVPWNSDLRDWSSQSYAMLYIDRGGFSACLCRGKHFAMQNDVPITRYALKKGYA